MKTLIIKLGAAGDVVRTTPLLRKLSGEIYWITEEKCLPLLKPLQELHACVPFSKRNSLLDIHFDVVINLEDTLDCCEFLKGVSTERVFGTFFNARQAIAYTEDSNEWFDLSIISRFGKKTADHMKLMNRSSYQEMIFRGLGLDFKGEGYILPPAVPTDCAGDIAIAPRAGSVWPMKNWAYYDGLIERLKSHGYLVNILPERASILEHISDIQNHRYVISGDSLPMHIALGSTIKCATFFICTSPWEIFDYGIQRKIISPQLDRYFYKRDFNTAATCSITLDEAFNSIIGHLKSA